jgi:hypothetical protein
LDSDDVDMYCMLCVLYVDLSVWVVGEIASHYWHRNYSNPNSVEFIALEEETQKQVGLFSITRILHYYTRVSAIIGLDRQSLVKNILFKKVDRIMLRAKLDENPVADIWRPVRSRPLTFLPGKPAACSVDVIPEPETESNLVLVERKTVEFGDYIEYKCKRNNFVTDAGPIFKLMCQTNGRFQTKFWPTCREKKLCYKPPPRPSATSGLDFSPSRNVAEGDFAVYTCRQAEHYVYGTHDGKFRTPCKRVGGFELSSRIDWPKCEPMGVASCTDVPKLPEGSTEYVKDKEDMLYMAVGEIVTFGCADPNLLLDGGFHSLTFVCAKRGNDTYSFNYDPATSLPACRQPAICDWASLPDPPPETGLEKPLQSKDILETAYIEYLCNDSPTSSLLGTYIKPTQFEAEAGEISGGKLRLYCTADGVFVPPTVWPVCRDAKITSCSNFPNVDSYGLTRDTNFPVAISDTFTLSCSDSSQVTDNFKTLDVVCNYDGEFILPDEGFTNCRAADACTPPDPPATTNLVAESMGSLKEFDTQRYACNSGFSLEGVQHDLVTVVGSVAKVELTCSVGADASTVDWPECRPDVDSCTEIPSMLGLYTLNTLAEVPVGVSIEYRCRTAGEVTDMGPSVFRKCLRSGLFEMPDVDVTCRKPVACEEPPAGPTPASANFGQLEVIPPKLPVVEFGAATYACTDGSELASNSLRLFPATAQGIETTDTTFSLQCGLGGVYPKGFIPWPNCEIKECIGPKTFDSFSTENKPRVDVGDTISYWCTNPAHISNDVLGPVNITCLPTGQFDYPAVFPTCRAKKDCPTNSVPEPPADKYLVTPSLVYLKEYDWLDYSCKDGAHLNTAEAEANPNVVDGAFKVQCGQHGEWPNTANVDWPTCQVDFCTDIVPLSAFQAVTTSQVPVNGKAVYKCTANYVTPTGPFLEVDCLADGTLDVPSTLPTCSPRKVCEDPPFPDPSTTYLLPTLVTKAKEWEEVFYSCQAGSHLNGKSENVFSAVCDVTNTNPPRFTAPTWPQCTVEFCVSYPLISSQLEPVDDEQWVAVGEAGLYRCRDASRVMNDGATLPLTCAADGSFTIPSEIPTCRAAASCSAPPTPPGNTNLMVSTSSGVLEYGHAVYECKDGAFFDEATSAGNAGIWDGKFHLECPVGGGSFPASPTWPTCTIRECVTLPDAANLPDFTPQTTPPVPAGWFADYLCTNPSHVISDREVRI